MTQAQIDLQQQLEQTSTDLTTQLLLYDFPVLFLEPIDQINASLQNKLNKLNIPLLQLLLLLSLLHMKHFHHLKNAMKI